MRRTSLPHCPALTRQATRGARGSRFGAGRLSLLFVGVLASACSGRVSSQDPGDEGPSGSDNGSGDDDGTGVVVMPPGAGGGGGSGGTTVVVNDKPFTPPAAHMLRLTRTQYDNTLADVFGPEVKLDKPIEADETNRPFLSLGAAAVGTSERGVEQYQEAAMDLAEQIWSRKSSIPALAACTPKAANDACVGKAVTALGRRLWRRPLTEAEVSRYTAVMAAVGTDAESLTVAFKVVLAGLLQSPHFLYVPFQGEADAQTGLRKLSSLELASRMSFFLWNTGPDEALLNAAETGKLVSNADIGAQVDRMLDDPRARAFVTKFFEENWKVSQLTAAAKDPEVFPEWTADLLAAYREEFRRVLEDLVFERDGDALDVLTGTTTIINRKVATAYGLSGGSDGFETRELGAAQTGLLTSGAVMAANAYSQRTSPTKRGVFVREQILCDEVPAPPQGLDTSFKNADPSLPLRERLAEHRDNPNCSGCHALFDPVGLTFEGLDGMGRVRSEEAGMAIDTSGEIDTVAVQNPRDLAKFLREQPRTLTCLTKQLLTFATGQEIGDKQEGAVDVASEKFKTANHSFKRLAREVVLSPAFRFMAQE